MITDDDKFFNIVYKLYKVDLDDYDELSVFHSSSISVAHVMCYVGKLKEMGLESRMIYSDRFGYAYQQYPEYYLKEKGLLDTIKNTNDKEELYMLSNSLFITPFKQFESFKDYIEKYGIDKVKQMISLFKKNDKFHYKVKDLLDEMYFFKETENSDGFSALEELDSQPEMEYKEVDLAVYYKDLDKLLDKYFGKENYHKEGEYFYVEGKYRYLNKEETIEYIYDEVRQELDSSSTDEDIERVIKTIKEYAEYDDGLTFDLDIAIEHAKEYVDELKEEEEEDD